MLLHVRVRPAAHRTRVGGRYPGDAQRGDCLLVAVTARAVERQANEAVVVALAEALSLSPREVRLVRGRTSRTKVVEVPDDCAPRVDRLLDAG
ncbi:MAG TPA: DUF167 domain-containing protein [Propionibacteriaceae bacterium]|nr:DUF167 domain-containing protein [Propionibacteriaceae bacterium]